MSASAATNCFRSVVGPPGFQEPGDYESVYREAGIDKLVFHLTATSARYRLESSPGHSNLAGPEKVDECENTRERSCDVRRP